MVGEWHGWCALPALVQVACGQTSEPGLVWSDRNVSQVQSLLLVKLYHPGASMMREIASSASAVRSSAMAETCVAPGATGGHAGAGGAPGSGGG